MTRRERNVAIEGLCLVVQHQQRVVTVVTSQLQVHAPGKTPMCNVPDVMHALQYVLDAAAVLVTVNKHSTDVQCSESQLTQAVLN